MKTITTKTAKNGAQLWYVDGKRTSRDKAGKTSIDNGRENLSNLLAGLTADPAVCNDIGIVAEMKSEFGDRYTCYYYFADAENAVRAARKIVALGTKQVHRMVIDNGRGYPSNIRYADTVRGKLVFLNGFERFNEADDDKDIDGYDESVFDLLPTVDELNDVDGFDSDACDACDDATPVTGNKPTADKDRFTDEDFQNELTVTLDINIERMKALEAKPAAEGSDSNAAS